MERVEAAGGWECVMDRVEGLGWTQLDLRSPQPSPFSPLLSPLTPFSQKVEREGGRERDREREREAPFQTSPPDSCHGHVPAPPQS